MANNAPGRHYRAGLTSEQVHEMFRTERQAENWFIKARWGRKEDAYCPHCGSTNVRQIPTRKPQPFRCRDCRKHFSIKTKTLMEGSNIKLKHWAKCLYWESKDLRGIPSMMLHREIGVTQKTAWFMLHRIRESYAGMCEGLIEDGGMKGTIEMDETAVGGKVGKMNAKQKKAFYARGGGTGFKGKEIIAGAKVRETGKIVVRQIDSRDRDSLQKLVEDFTAPGSTVYTDEAKGYKGMDREHKAVNHSAKHYVLGLAHTNGMESFWFALKRGFDSFIKVSPKHVVRYAIEFAGRHNDRPVDTIEQMTLLAKGMVGRRLTYADLIADNGKSNFARPLGGTPESDAINAKVKAKKAKREERELEYARMGAEFDRIDQAMKGAE